ncbi:chemoreceptor glutamine deamidase CheD [Alkalimarinus alittae]|uniref:Probable chemoreceptor glutamine deamidase CheD n=1 Tax=Alkalimarinus alittae TaxID=2961619 RepID=A0ABY6MYW0_9ALTE|nr:chemoreceptor glutamine deamidase CheD [Alkalimarinus alittae]UZE94954.1 chemoreceptor glutamine deamidase CheD [Alkalimarinus alittae]
MDNSVSLPKALPGFEHINRYWDKRMNLAAAKILPGEFYVSLHGEMIATVLGSCISACIRDRVHGIGGMNHFMLPSQGEYSSVQWGSSHASSASRYGNWAMEFLINEILKAGGERKNLEVKVFGGGNVLSNMTRVGLRNIEFVKTYLAQEGLRVEASDVGDLFPRKVLYFPDTGAVKVRKLKQTRNDTVLQREKAYIEDINKQPKSGDIELF